LAFPPRGPYPPLMRVGGTQPCVLTIAGSDSGGGAGIQADLKAFGALGVHGATAITCLTAQNPSAVLGIQPCRPEMVRRQIEAVLSELPPRAIKTGMLHSRGIVRVVVEAVRALRGTPLVIDPVMVATSGRQLLEPSALRLLREDLLPLAMLVTPNIPEAEALAEVSIVDPETMRQAGRVLQNRYGCAALVKGGHLRGGREAVDLFYDGRQELLLTAPFIPGLKTHGTGCTYSAAIAAFLALGHDLAHAVVRAKRYVTRAIALSTRVGRHTVLGSTRPARKLLA